jgi:medium-chain acyl-[acyl-carrier-protein] hydrolase
VLQDPELLHLLLPLLRADFALCETYTYTPEPPLSCPISAIGGLQDSEIPRENIVAWNKQTTNALFKLHFLAGDHFFLHNEQATLIRVLTQDLLNDLHG